MIFTNIWELLYDMRLNGSDEMLPADSPPKYGWVCCKTEKQWEITLWDANKSAKLGDEESQKVLKKYFSSNEQRRHIKEMLNELPNLEKLNKLKAFW